MKKIAIVALIIVAVILAGCGSSPSASAPVPSGMPPWINDIPPDDVIWGDGFANLANPQRNLETAEARARTAIARDLDSRVQAMFTDYFMEAGGANTELVESVSRQVTDMRLTGTRRVQAWEAPGGGLWVRVQYNKADARNAVASIINNQEALYAQFKAQQALALLDHQLSQNNAAQRVQN